MLYVFPLEKSTHPLNALQTVFFSTLLRVNQGVLPKWSVFSNHSSVLTKGRVTYLGLFLKTFNQSRGQVLSEMMILFM